MESRSALSIIISKALSVYLFMCQGKSCTHDTHIHTHNADAFIEQKQLYTRIVCVYEYIWLFGINKRWKNGAEDGCVRTSIVWFQN